MIARVIRRSVWLVAVLLAASLFAHSQQTPETSPPQSRQKDAPMRVSLCQLVSKPELYNKKEVTVQATYYGGNEWSVLLSADCSSDKNLVWLEPSNERVRDVIKLGPQREPVTFNLKVRGTFVSGGKYGHLGRYNHKIIATDLSKAGNS